MFFPCFWAKKVVPSVFWLEKSVFPCFGNVSVFFEKNILVTLISGFSTLQFAPENYFFSGSRAGNGASSTAGRFVSNSPEQTVVHNFRGSSHCDIDVMSQ